MLRLPTWARSLLSKPIGILYRGDSLWKDHLHILGKKPTVTVGDIVTRDYIKNLGKAPSLAVIDGKTQRTIESGALSGIDELFDETKQVTNLPGTVNIWEIRAVISEVLLGFPNIKTLLKVSGEEDLLVLPILLTLSGHGDLNVLYGQPNRGVVVIRTSPSSRALAEAVTQVMEANLPIYSMK